MSEHIEIGRFAERRTEQEHLAIQKLLYCLGVTQNYKGFGQMVFAVELCRKEPERLLLVTKWVYSEVAGRYGTSRAAVERNIRTVRDIIWGRNRPMLERMARVPLRKAPCPAELLAILVAQLASEQDYGDER